MCTHSAAMPWAKAIALGAIVALPDAVAARRSSTAAATASHPDDSRRRESAERRERSIYRLAVGAVAVNGFSAEPRADILLAGRCERRRRSGAWVAHVAVMERVQRADRVILQFVTTLAVWMLAERIGLSGVLTMVCYAMTAQTAPDEFLHGCAFRRCRVGDGRLSLNILAFIFIGLQIRPFSRASTRLIAADTSRSPARLW